MGEVDPHSAGPAGLRALGARVRSLVAESLSFDKAGRSRKQAFLLGSIRLWIQVGKGLVRDKCLQQASSLAYKTALSVVPLAAVALSLVKAFGGFEGRESAVVVFLSRQLLAVEPAAVAGHITEYTDQLSFGAIGGVGVAVLLLVAVSLLDTVERTLNDVFKSPMKRGLLARFTTYYAVITLAPMMLTLSLYQTAKVQAVLSYGVVGRLTPYLWPVLVTWIMLLSIYKLFPSARVKWGPAVTGALMSAVGFELAKWGFKAFYVETVLSDYNRIYGALALVPLFLAWLYVVWIVVLFGAEYAYTRQNLARLVQRERERRFENQDELARQTIVNEHLAVRVMVHIAADFDAGRGGAARDKIAQALSAPEEAVTTVLAALVRGGFLICHDPAGPARGPAGGPPDDDRRHAPARPLDRIRIADIAAAFRAGRLDSGRAQGDPASPVERRLLAAETAFLDALRGATLLEMVRAPEGAPLLVPSVAYGDAAG